MDLAQQLDTGCGDGFNLSSEDCAVAAAAAEIATCLVKRPHHDVPAAIHEHEVLVAVIISMRSAVWRKGKNIYVRQLAARVGIQVVLLPQMVSFLEVFLRSLTETFGQPVLSELF